MHVHNTTPHQHKHSYFSGHERTHERRTWYVVALTAVMMAAEVTGGFYYNSMALLADGWHMSTHVGALGISGFAYVFARTQAHNPRFTFGTGKVSALGGFTSSLLLMAISVAMVVESLLRLAAPRPILFNEAIVIAAVGLVINLVSALMLKEDHAAPAQGENHSHTHDHNMRAAYLHVLADALTSILAILALLMGKYWGLIWMDPIMGIVGSIIIVNWSLSLMSQTSRILLDTTADSLLENSIRTVIESDSDNQITDLHVWHIAPGKFSTIISLVTDSPKPPQHYKTLLHDFHQLVHVTIEVNNCEQN